MMGDPNELWLLTTDDGYGFVARLEDLITDRKAGKTVVNVNEGATTLRPQRVFDVDRDRVAAATSEGKLLLFPVSELPQLARGKGVQTIKIHRTPIAPEKVVSTAVVPWDGTLVVHAGKRFTNLKPSDLESYVGKRRFEMRVAREGLEMDFRSWAYPLETYMAALEDAGLLVEAIREPPDPDRPVPNFLLLRALKPRERPAAR